MGSGTHCSKTDGFPGTHGTHANGATDSDRLEKTDIDLNQLKRHGYT